MTNETKQTAVEWYGIEMGKLFAQYHGKKICIGEFHTKRFELEHKAKEMEKEQMKMFGIKCQLDYIKNVRTVDEIYNETYGGNK